MKWRYASFGTSCLICSFSLFHIVIWRKKPLWHSHVSSIKLQEILGNYNGQTQTLWFDKKKLRVQFLMSNDNLFSVKLQWAHARMMFELRFFTSHCDLTKIKSGKLQWADDANKSKNLCTYCCLICFFSVFFNVIWRIYSQMTIFFPGICNG